MNNVHLYQYLISLSPTMTVWSCQFASCLNLHWQDVVLFLAALLVVVYFFMGLQQSTDGGRGLFQFSLLSFVEKDRWYYLLNGFWYHVLQQRLQNQSSTFLERPRSFYKQQSVSHCFPLLYIVGFIFEVVLSVSSEGSEGWGG